MHGACLVDEVRDCGNGVCILAAIRNFTSQLVDPSLSSDSRQVALKFISEFTLSVVLCTTLTAAAAHVGRYCIPYVSLLTVTMQFFGDIAQPLHVEVLQFLKRHFQMLITFCRALH